jgi:hypothetical protein
LSREVGSWPESVVLSVGQALLVHLTPESPIPETIPNVTVTLIENEVATSQIVALDGRAEFATSGRADDGWVFVRVDDEAWEIRADPSRHGWLQSSGRRLNVEELTQGEVRLTLCRKRSIVGRVETTGGEPLAGTELLALSSGLGITSPAEIPTGHLARTRSSSDGTFRFDGLSNAHVSILVSDPEWRVAGEGIAHQRPLTPQERRRLLAETWAAEDGSTHPQSPILIQMERACRVRGTVRDSSGQTISGAEVQYLPKELSIVERSRQALGIAPQSTTINCGLKTLTDGSGAFELDPLPAMTAATLFATASDGRRGSIQVSLTPGKTTETELVVRDVSGGEVLLAVAENAAFAGELVVISAHPSGRAAVRGEPMYKREDHQVFGEARIRLKKFSAGEKVALYLRSSDDTAAVFSENGRTLTFVSLGGPSSPRLVEIRRLHRLEVRFSGRVPVGYQVKVRAEPPFEDVFAFGVVPPDGRVIIQVSRFGDYRIEALSSGAIALKSGDLQRRLSTFKVSTKTNPNPVSVAE